MAGRTQTDDDLRAIVRVAFDELGCVPGGIGGVHSAIARRVFTAVGPPSAPVRAIHDALAGTVYAGVRGGALLVGRGADLALAHRPGEGGRRLSATPGGAAVIGALTGLRGDSLESEGNALCEPMAVRVRGEPVGLERRRLAEAFPRASGRLAVFVHGLMETEFAWKMGAAKSCGTYGERLQRDLGFTPVELRYNTGRHISENGRALFSLLRQLAEAWPVDVRQIALIGHSMGGLVVRSACHTGSAERARWASLLSHSISLGSPHMGAPLEQGVHLLSAGLAAIPETQPLARFLRRRSSGIRDLRHGSLVDEDWRGRDRDALRSAACLEVPLLDGATHCFVSATVTRSPRHPLGRLIGDALVLVPSASGRSRTRRIPFEDEQGAHVGGASHLALLNHPQVYEKLYEWLAVPAGATVATARAATPSPRPT